MTNVLAVVGVACTVTTTVCIAVQTYMAIHIRSSARIMAGLVRPPRREHG